MGIACWTAEGTIDMEDLRPADLSAEVLGATLARLNRFGGRTPEPWPVAAHSVLVEALCPPDLKPWALLHDAHEAFIGDWTDPAVAFICRCGTKAAVEHALANARARLDRAIGAAWGVAVRSESIALRHADRIALIAEAWAFMDIRPEIDSRADIDAIDSAMAVLAGMVRAHHWREARDLWVARAEHHAGLGRLRLPGPGIPAGAVPAGQPRGE